MFNLAALPATSKPDLFTLIQLTVKAAYVTVLHFNCASNGLSCWRLLVCHLAFFVPPNQKDVEAVRDIGSHEGRMLISGVNTVLGVDEFAFIKLHQSTSGSKGFAWGSNMQKASGLQVGSPNVRCEEVPCFLRGDAIYSGGCVSDRCGTVGRHISLGVWMGNLPGSCSETVRRWQHASQRRGESPVFNYIMSGIR